MKMLIERQNLGPPLRFEGAHEARMNFFNTAQIGIRHLTARFCRARRPSVEVEAAALPWPRIGECLRSALNLTCGLADVCFRGMKETSKLEE